MCYKLEFRHCLAHLNNSRINFHRKLVLILLIKITSLIITICGQYVVSQPVSSSLGYISQPVSSSVKYIPLQTRDEFGGQMRSSDCALILQRTYAGGRRTKTEAPLYRGFFDLFRRGGFLSQDAYYGEGSGAGQYQETCVRYMDVNRAMKQAMHNKRYQKPRGIESMEPHPNDIGETGEMMLETTKILMHQFDMSYDEVLNGLPLIDMSRTHMWDHCPHHVKPIPCVMERYRSYTAHCNNMKNPSWGAANTPFVRYLPPVYSNGLDGDRVSVIKGAKLPNVRAVTSICHRDFDHPSNDFTVLVMSWGQLIDHDVALAAGPRDDKDHEITCCGKPKESQHHLCHNIDIPPNDPLYAPYGQTCMDFKKSVAGQRPNCALGPRVHVNTLTSMIDANFVYGSTEAIALKLRSFRGGLMKTWDRFRDYGLKPLLPPESENPERDCIGRPRHLYCFIAGDERVNEQIHLTVLHTLYVRDHNRMAIELGRLNPHWDDEKLYQETRHIAAAAVQHIFLSEFLPLVIGEELMHRYNLTEVKDGYWNGYDPEVHTAPSQAFTTAAFRFGHTFIQGMIRRYNKYHEFIGEDPLRTLLRQPFIVYEPGKMDELALGLINTPAQTYDPFITSEVSGHLFQEPHHHVGLDLPAINLARAREQGVPGYNIWREWCGLSRAETFQDLEPILNNNTAYHYSRLYAHVDDIDLWSGGISEKRLPGALIGPTFACIVARNFANIRRGDRFWFENSGFPSAFTPEQLHQIKMASQAKIICDNSDDMPTVQMFVLRQAHPIFNPRVRCEDLPSIDLRYWQEDAINGGFPYKKK